MALAPNATYAPTPRGLTLQLCHLFDEIASRLDGDTDAYAVNQRVKDGDFEDLIDWLTLQDPVAYLRHTYGDVCADWWEESRATGPLKWPVHEMLLDLTPEVALGARAAKVEFSGFVEWAIHDPDLNHVLSPEMVVRAYVRPAWEDAEEGLVGGYEQEGWLHDGARWVCTGRALDLSRSEDLAERIQAHLMATDFGELRSLLQRPPDVSVWNHLGLYLSMLNERDDFASAIVPYITDHVEDWPVALRKARVGAPEIVPLLGVAVVNDPAELGDARPAGVEVHSAEALLELLEHPVAQTLEVLHTFGEQMTLELARALALARLPRLEVLRMHHDTWQPGAGQVFERTPWLEGLRELHVGGHGLGPTWVNLFGGEELERVTYPGDDADVSDLLGSLSRLRALSAFSSNADILAAILSSPAPLALEALWLVEGVEEDALMALAQTNRLPELETLVASSPRGMLRAARALARSASLPKLKNIVLL